MELSPWQRSALAYLQENGEITPAAPWLRTACAALVQKGLAENTTSTARYRISKAGVEEYERRRQSRRRAA